MIDHGGLRGIAAVWVVVFHCLYYDKNPVDALGSTLMPLFFLLSGFSLTVGYYSRLLSPDYQPAAKSEAELQVVNPEEGVPQSMTGNEQNNDKANAKAKVPMTFGNFQFLRALRVMPVYYITFLMSIPPLLCGFGPFNPTSNVTVAASTITNIIPVNSWIFFLLGYGQPFIGPTWTICTLWFFWLCFPSLLRSYNQKTDEQLLRSIVLMYFVQLGVGIIIFAGLSALLPPVAFAISTMWPPSRLPIFVMGICAGLLVMRHVGKPTMPWFYYGKVCFPYPLGCCKSQADVTAETFSSISVAHAVQLLVITIIVFIIDAFERFMMSGNGILGAFWLQLLNPFSQLCLTVALTRLGNLTNLVTMVLRQRIWQWLGDLSMSIYLVHMLVYYYLRWALSGKRTLHWPDHLDCSTYNDDDAKHDDCQTALDNFNDDYILPNWNVLVVLPISILLAWIFFHLVEEPIRKYWRG